MANLRGQSNSARALRSGVSFIAICAFATSTPAFAQSTQDRARRGDASQSNSNFSARPIDEARSSSPASAQSLRSAQNIKRNSDTVVDVDHRAGYRRLSPTAP